MVLNPGLQTPKVRVSFLLQRNKHMGHNHHTRVCQPARASHVSAVVAQRPLVSDYLLFHQLWGLDEGKKGQGREAFIGGQIHRFLPGPSTGRALCWKCPAWLCGLYLRTVSILTPLRLWELSETSLPKRHTGSSATAVAWHRSHPAVSEWSRLSYLFIHLFYCLETWTTVGPSGIPTISLVCVCKRWGGGRGWVLVGSLR